MRNLWVAFLALLSAAALSAQKYAVHMSPPVPVGQVFTVSATGSTLLQTSIGDRVLMRPIIRSPSMTKPDHELRTLDSRWLRLILSIWGPTPCEEGGSLDWRRIWRLGSQVASRSARQQ